MVALVMWEIREGDALERLLEMPDGEVQTVVTSPPYWGLRDYGEAGQIGLEPTPEEYVARLVAVFREVRRVLRDDGTLWLNIGDSYAATTRSAGASMKSTLATRPTSAQTTALRDGGSWRTELGSLKPKDLVGIPWRVAFALQADGWYLRSDIIWAKPNPMPESVTDRPTKSHEYLFLLAKGQWRTRVVQFSDLPSERVHFGKHVGTGSPYSRPGAFCVRHATAIFDRAQREHGFGLPPFYAEEWQQGPHEGYGDFVGSLPIEHRATAWAARLLSANTTAKEFVQQIDALTVTLPERGDLLIGGVPTGVFPGSPRVASDREGTVTIHDSGEVGTFNFRRHELSIARPVRCSYYYDADAIKEDAICDRKRGTHDWSHVPNGGDNSGLSHGVFTVRNRRTVWTIPTQPFAGAHFAVFPPALVEPCILAGSREDDLVLDPFAGAATVGVVCRLHRRRFLGIELNPEYARMARGRLGETPAVGLECHPDLPLFAPLGGA